MLFRSVFGKAKSGIFAGLVGGFALFSSFIGIDSHLGIEPGTFYKMIGISIGLDGIGAIAFGFVVHMLTASLIGAVFYAISSLHRSLNLVTIPKAILVGGITGLVVFALFFIPIHTLVMVPIVESIIESGTAPDISQSFGTQTVSLKTLISNTEGLFLGAIILHMLFGMVMGFFCGLMAHEEYSKVRRYNKFL